MPLMRKRMNSLAANTTPLHQRNQSEFMMIILGGSSLAFNSGFINGCTLLTSRPLPVSHVTGTTSHAGINLANGDYDMFGIETCLITCFIFGASITGYWMPINSFQLGRQYGPLFLIGSVMLSLACITSYYEPESNWYYYFAAMASGLQNGMTTKYSGSIIRTTHLTGTATDIGLVLGRMAIGDWTDVWKLQVLLPLALSFFSGGYLSTYAVRRMGKLSLLVNVLIFFSVGLVYSLFVSFTMEISLWSVFLGTYKSAGQKLKDAKIKFHSHEKVSHVIGSMKVFKNKLHSRAKAVYRSRAHVTPFSKRTRHAHRGGSATEYSKSSEDEETDSYSTLNPIHSDADKA